MPKKKEKWIFKLTHVNDKNRAIHKWDLVDILQEKRKHKPETMKNPLKNNEFY